MFNADEVYFTSDLHLGHDRQFIYEKRGFRNIVQHDAAIIGALRSLRCEHLFIVGDVAMGASKAERVLRLIDSLPYPTTLILGNHDPSAEALRDAHPVQQLEMFLTDQSGEHVVTLSHYPCDFVDHRGRDFSDVMPPDNGGLLFHGHTHRDSRVTLSAHNTTQLHVGWDAWGRPVSGSELLAIVPAAV